VATTVYTDGACSGNPGPGGWAWAVPAGEYRSGAEAASTNQRMEIQAALEAVTSLTGPLEVVSDSTYVVNCFRDRWWERWVEKGWVNSQRKPVANRDLWEPLVAAVQADAKRVHFTWVKGHANDPMNDLVDRLAVEAARTQKGRSGVGVPADLGAADVPSGAGSTGGAAPPLGHRVVVAGLRPPGLGGYGDNPIAADVRRRLADILAAKAKLHDDLVVLTGLGLGAEQLGAEAALDAGVPYVGVVAFPDQQSVWPPESQRRYESLLGKARDVITLQQKRPESKQAAGGALARRDAWLARNAHEALAVWDDDDPAIGRLVRSLRDHLGEEDVWVVRPS
jgi:ribonuclease HI/uncharacterized phage-like protein YoqJ